MVPEDTSPTCAELADLIPAYVLEALSPADASRVEAHLAECPACSDDAAGYRLVAERLLRASPPVTPPVHLQAEFASLLERDAAVRLDDDVSTDDLRSADVLEDDEPRRVTAPDGPSTPPAPRPSVAGQPAPRGLGWAVRLGQALNEPQRRWSLGAVTTTLLLVVALLGTNLYWAVISSTLRSDREDLTALVEGQEAALATLATGGSVVLLRGGEAAPGASGTLTITAEGGEGVLVVNDLARQPLGKAYQLWLIHDGERDSGGLFTVDAQGRAVMHVEGPARLDSYQEFGVTLEPEGGSPGPTSPPSLSSA